LLLFPNREDKLKNGSEFSKYRNLNTIKNERVITNKMINHFIG